VWSGDEIPLPADPGGLTLVGIDFRMTARGRWWKFAYKVPRPVIAVNYADGGRARHPLAWANAAAGLVLSDLPRNQDELRHLLAGRLAGRVRSISLDVPDAFEEQVPLRLIRVDWLGDGR
jgi:hypothetical protein